MAELPFRQLDGDDETPWVSVSDLMSGLMLVFLCIAVFFMMRIQEEKEQVEEAKEQIEAIARSYSSTEQAIIEALRREFPDPDRMGMELDVDKGELKLRFLDEQAGYAPNQRSVPPAFQRNLTEVLPRLKAAIYDPAAIRDHVVELRIEGHTSSDWYRSGPREAYLNNMELSQHRARAVLAFLLNLGVTTRDPDFEDWFQQRALATGLSSSKPVLGADGSEDGSRSKRVELRILTDSDATVRQILNLGDDAP